MDINFMLIASEEAKKAVSSGDGGPFGAVIVRNGKMLTSAHNMVLRKNDPTAHAEITAIRNACEILERYSLHDCELYTSCEPCPMCFAAIHWARIPMIYYGCTADDAADAGFDDQVIYTAISDRAKYSQKKFIQLERNACLEAMEIWKNSSEKKIY